MILTLENLRQKFSALEMLLQAGLRRFLIQFERNDQVRTQSAGELTRHDYGVAAERTAGCTQCLIADDLAAARFTGIRDHARYFIRRPVVIGLTLPIHLVFGL